MGWRDHEDQFVGHQSKPREIEVRMVLQVTNEPDADADLLRVVEKEMRLQFGSMVVSVHGHPAAS